MIFVVNYINFLYMLYLYLFLVFCSLWMVHLGLSLALAPSVSV